MYIILEDNSGSEQLQEMRIWSRGNYALLGEGTNIVGQASKVPVISINKCVGDRSSSTYELINQLQCDKEVGWDRVLPLIFSELTDKYCATGQQSSSNIYKQMCRQPQQHL